MNNERTRAWRRYTNYIKKNKGMGSDKLYQPIKNWKHLGTRKQKLLRAKQLGFEYPRIAIQIAGKTND